MRHNYYYWSSALEFSCLDWIAPLLPSLGLPFNSSDDMWCVHSMREQFEHELNPMGQQVRIFWEQNRGKASDELAKCQRLALDTSLQQLFKDLAESLGEETARAFERWIRRHYIDRDTESELYFWYCCFLNIHRLGSIPPEKGELEILRQNQPDFLMYILPQGERSYFAEYTHLIDILDIAYLAGNTEESVEPARYIQRSAAYAIMTNELIIRTLTKINRELTSAEIHEFMNWLEKVLNQFERSWTTMKTSVRRDFYSLYQVDKLLMLNHSTFI